MFDFLEDNLLIICPNSYKLAILKYLGDNKLLFNIKFMSFDEYKKGACFDYDVNTIHYLVQKNIKPDNAITIINNLYYIENKKYHNEKLDYLVKIKNELEKNNLLIYDEFFSKLLKSRKVIVYGYGKLDLFKQKLISDKMVIPYQNYDKKYNIYHFNNIQNEVEFVFQSIAKLLKDGVNINNICLMNIDDDYLPYLKMMEFFYHININYQDRGNLMGTVLGQTFYDLVLSGKKREEIFNLLQEFQSSQEYSFIIDLLNKYIEFNLLDCQEEIKHDLLNHSVSQESFDNPIKIKNVFDYVGSEEYVFLLNFNNGSIPKLKMDTDYITNNISDLVGIEKIEDKNELIKMNTLSYLSNIPNIIISYKDTSPFKKYYPSLLLDYMNYDIKEYERSLNYAELANRMVYTTYLDDYFKYGIKNKNFELLYSNYGINNYQSYHNDFSLVDKNSLLKYLNNELVLSYSSIDNYYQCGFKYYLENVLKIDVFKENFNTIIGSLFHYVLSKMNEKDFDLEKEYNYYLKDKVFNNKEKFFLNKLKNDLYFIVETIKKHQFITGFTNMLYEKKFDIKLMNDPYVHLKGFIDKIIYQEEGMNTLVSIIDYKTGNQEINIKNLEFGLSMQLPIYLYLINNSDILKNIKFTGFYLQHILNINVKKTNKKTIEEEKYNRLKLDGYSTSDIDRLSIFDKTYENSSIIKGMKTTKDGNISKISRVLSDDEVNNILKLTHEKIMLAVNEILDGNFKINPKIINNKNISCEYCNFKDVCYHDERNNVYLYLKGGDNNDNLD